MKSKRILIIILSILLVFTGAFAGLFFKQVGLPAFGALDLPGSTEKQSAPLDTPRPTLQPTPKAVNLEPTPAGQSSNQTYLPNITRTWEPLTFLETFDGAPKNPQPWQPSNWDVTIHSRDPKNINTLPAMHAGHGVECEPPPDSHSINTYEDSVFICRDHVMTAINDSGYGVIYLTPNHMVDFSRGEAIIRFDVSTERTSMRDWIDLWITPYENHLQLPLTEWLPDLNGEPRRSIQIEMGDFNSQSPFKVFISRNYRVEEVKGLNWVGYEEFLTPSAGNRDTFELRISKTHIKFGMPEYDFWWVDKEIAPLDWSQGVIQFGHHSYNPTKECSGCAPNTWHWDNVFVEPAIPFTILRAEQRYSNKKGNRIVTLPEPAPQGANLRFAGVGKNIEVSYDGGKNWQTAMVQEQKRYDEGTFWSYWTPIPAGTKKISFRGQTTWAGDWQVRDISVWSLESSSR